MKIYIITSLDILKSYKKANREIIIFPKPTVTMDKKKQCDKLACRKVKFNNY